MLFECTKRVKETVEFNFLRQNFEWEQNEFVSFMSTFTAVHYIVNAVTVGILTPVAKKYLKVQIFS